MVGVVRVRGNHDLLVVDAYLNELILLPVQDCNLPGFGSQ